MRIEKVNQTSSSPNVFFFPYGNLPYPSLPNTSWGSVFDWYVVVGSNSLQPQGVLEAGWDMRSKPLNKNHSSKGETPNDSTKTHRSKTSACVASSFHKFRNNLGSNDGKVCTKTSRFRALSRRDVCERWPGEHGGTLNEPLVFGWSSGLVCRGWPYLHKGAPGDLFTLLKTNSCDPENRPGPKRK